MKPNSSKFLLQLLVLLCLGGVSIASDDFQIWQPQQQQQQQQQSVWPSSTNSRLPFGFDSLDWDQPSFARPAAFSSVSQSSKSESKQSRTEETLQEVRKSAKSVEWNRGFQDDGKGGVKQVDSVATNEKSAGRSAKELKASESGDSAQRDRSLTQVNGRTVVSADSGKQSSFSNSGHAANRTEFSSESSSVDNHLAKAFLPPPPPPALATCLSRSRASLFLLVHTSSSFGGLGRVLTFLDAFLHRLAPSRVIVVFFNRRVLDVIDEAEAAVVSAANAIAALRRRLASTVNSLRDHLADECNLPEAVAAAERLRRQLRFPSPCSLIVLTPAGPGIRVDERALAEAAPAAQSARRVFDQLTTVVGDDRDLDPRAADMLKLFGGSIVPLDFSGGERIDAVSADALGRRLCDSLEGSPGDARSSFDGGFDGRGSLGFPDAGAPWQRS